MAAGHPEMARPAKEAGKLPTPEIPAEFGHKQRPALLAPTTFLKQVTNWLLFLHTHTHGHAGKVSAHTKLQTAQ